MQYATRTQNGQKQLLTFSKKKNRDEYVWFEDGKAITAQEAKAMQPVGLAHSVQGVNCIFTVQNVAS